MLLEAYVKTKVNENTFDCLVAISEKYTRLQRFMLYPLKKRHKDNFDIEDILHRQIYIWKHPYYKMETNYLGQIFYKKENKIYIINQAFEEIYKKIE